MIKLIKNEGSAMTIVIIAMALLLITGSTIISQVNNQLKSTNKIYKDTQYQYIAEAGVENSIAEIYSQINEFIDEVKSISEDKYKNEDWYSSGGMHIINESKIIDIPLKTSVLNNDSKLIISNNEDNKRHINANTKIVMDVIMSNNDKKVESREIKSKTIDSLKDIEIVGIASDGINIKYRVTYKVDFNIDDSYNLTYEIKEYNKEPM